MEETRSEVIALRLTPDEKASVERQAKAAGQKVPDYIRVNILPRKAEPKPEDSDRVNTLMAEGMPRHNARILAAREKAKADGGPRIGDIFKQRKNINPIRNEKGERLDRDGNVIPNPMPPLRT